MIQVQHDEPTTREEIVEADDANDDARSTPKCPMISNGTAHREDESVIGDAGIGDEERGLFYEMEEEDDEELYQLLEEDVVNPNDKKAQNIVPTRVKTKVSC